MNTVTKEEIKESIEKKLKNWMDPEDVGYGEVLSLNFSSDGQSAFALVLYPNSSIEIDYLFFSVFSNDASISCEKRIDFHDEEFDEHAKWKNDTILSTVKDVYKTMIRRFD